jgi:phenylalanyl-tRNA synthetase beta subunit
VSLRVKEEEEMRKHLLMKVHRGSVQGAMLIENHLCLDTFSDVSFELAWAIRALSLGEF